MKKTTKGALAAGTAAFMMLGGAGTLAYWTDDASVEAGSVQSGKLALLAGSTTAVWTLNDQPIPNDEWQSVELVPGDVLEYVGSYEIDAAGDNLQGTLAVTGGALTGELAAFVDESFAWTYNGLAPVLNADGVVTFDELSDGDQIGLAITVDFPFDEGIPEEPGAASSMSRSLDLSEIEVVLEQTDATP